jgi:hypothetical protein
MATGFSPDGIIKDSQIILKIRRDQKNEPPLAGSIFIGSIL